MQDLASAISRCPFLHKVSASQGEGFALQIALNPFKPASRGQPCPVVLEEGSLGSLEATVKLFHGPGGIVPLKRFTEAAPAPQQAGCPYHHHSASQPSAGSPAIQLAPAAPAAPARPFGSLPMASMSISAFGFMPDPGEFFRGGRPRKQRQQHQKPQQKQPGGGGPSGGSNKPGGGPQQRGGSGGGGRPGGGPQGGKGKPPSSSAASTKAAAPGTSSPLGGSSRSSVGSGGSGGGLKSTPAPAGGTGGQCPMRRFLGPAGGLLPLAASGKLKLQCPSAIIKMRAAVAALKPVRELRPQALPYKLLAMGAVAVAANVPCGMWREHTAKFSPEWFLAVHATIPFVAMLRKAVLMPKWAVLLTVLGAVAGQQAGAKLERRRLGLLREQAGAAEPAPKSTGGRKCQAGGPLEPALPVQWWGWSPPPVAAA